MRRDVHISRKILMAALALGTVAIEAASAPASAATDTTTMSIGLTITAPIDSAARHDRLGSKAGAALKGTIISEIAKSTGIKPVLTSHRIASANSDTIVKTLSY